MQYYCLRITPETCNPKVPLIAYEEHLMRSLFEYLKPIRATSGLENHDKYGDLVKKHIHYRFQCDKNKNSIAKWLQNTTNKGLGIKGVGYQLVEYTNDPSLCNHNKPKSQPRLINDIKRWFRYCLKEFPHSRFNTGFSLPELEVMSLLANDERNTNIKYHRERREKMNKKLTLFDRVNAFLNKNILPGKTPTYSWVYINIIDYFVKNNNGVNHNNIKSYTNLYLLKNKFITSQAFFHQNHLK